MEKAFLFFRIFTALLLFSGWILSGCNYPVAQKATPRVVIIQPTAKPTVYITKATPTLTPRAHVSIPGTPFGKLQTIHDQVNKNYASQKRAYGGDEFKIGRFERPFDKQMAYLGYLDIVKVTMTRSDPTFIFVAIQLAEPIIPAVDKPAYYGLEIDLNLDGRSLYFIRAERPFTETWTTDGVEVWKSTLADEPVGGSSIPVTGTAGFDMAILSAGKGEDIDLAWARLKPGLTDTVEIAFKNSLVGGEKGKFVWRPFSDGAPFHPNQYDLQNSYTLEEAGSPLGGDPFYPLKAVYAVDNTCRVTSGYTATGKEPGICPQPIEPEPEGPPGGPGPTEVPLI